MTPSSSSPQRTGDTRWSSPLDSLLGTDFGSQEDSAGVAPIQHAAPHFGTPGHDAEVWEGQQSYPDTCAIRCQEFVLEQFTGVQRDETDLVREAMDAGWYAPGAGTSPQDVGNLLESHGIPVNRYEGATVFHLANELAQGHKVIVGVDSGELWGEHPILEAISDKLGISGADHAVVVSGIDTSDPDHVQVIISDPGTGEAAATYPMDQFFDAWRDSNCFMVATQDPAPASLPEMANFDYSLGHLDEVWGMPYEQFLGLADQPENWDQALDDALALLDDGSDDIVDMADSGLDADSSAWNEAFQGIDDNDEGGAVDDQDPSDRGF